MDKVTELKQKKENCSILVIPLNKGADKKRCTGECPNCKAPVNLAGCILDDTYNCVFQCPHCAALLFLSPTKNKSIRGYRGDGGKMDYDLPCKHEIKMNCMPTNTPTGECLNCPELLK